jgi:glycosyltransferase involved in cell wall biosynthesis
VLRILFSVPGYKPAWRLGGPVISVPALAESLVRRGHEVIVFATNSNLDQVLDVEPNRPHDVDGVQVWYFEKEEPLQRWFPAVSYLAKSVGVLYSPRMASELARVVPGIDVVHTHLPFIYPTFAAARAAARHRKPLFYHQRGVFDPQRLKFRALKKKLYLNLIERPIMRGATTLIALTDAEAESYRRLGVGTPSRVIPNGIEPFAIVGETDPLTARLGIRPGHLVVLFMGRVHPIKGADKLIEGFLRIQREHPDAVLVIAGPDEFGLEAQFRERVRTAGAADRVIFPGMVEGSLKHALLQRADLFCLPSDAEGFSMAILEALAAGTAVLISPGCHFDEVERVGAGVVVDAAPAALAAALGDLLRDRQRLASMGARGAGLVRSKYTWDAVADQMIDTYCEGIERHRRTLDARPQERQ